MIASDMNRQALDFLHDVGQGGCISLMEPLRHGEADVVILLPGGLVLRHHGGIYICLCTDGKYTGDLAAAMEGAQCVNLRTMGSVEEFSRLLGLPVSMHCAAIAWTQKTPPSCPASCRALEVYPAEEKDIPFIIQHYTYGDAAYVHDRISHNMLFVGRVGEEPIGFIGLHPEGAMGLLHIVPAWRRKGYARGLESWLCTSLMARGRIPFGDIVISNTASLRLHEKTGFTQEEVPSYWLENPY